MAFLVSATGLSISACARRPEPSLDPMHTTICDTTQMKPLGLAVEIPAVHVRADFGALTGAVIQDETGDAIWAAVVDLTATDSGPDATRLTQYTNPKGGFSFDSVPPATYRLRVRRIGEIAAAEVATGDVGAAERRDHTLSLRMRASRCYGY